MHFDGAHSQHGTGASIVFTSLLGDTMKFSYKLEFEATNNVVEYEALFLGLELATEMGINFMSDRGF
jgi:ribonuclease HI